MITETEARHTHTHGEAPSCRSNDLVVFLGHIELSALFERVVTYSDAK